MRLMLIAVLAALIGTCSSPPSMLEQVIQLGELRVVTRDAPTTYFITPEGPAGPEYDLVRGFAESLGVTLVIETVENISEILPRVNEGHAHMAAAGLSMKARLSTAKSSSTLIWSKLDVPVGAAVPGT